MDGTIDEIIERLNFCKEKYSDYSNLRINEDIVYEGGYYCELMGDRLETEEEEADRLKYEKENDDRRLAYERLQYEELKKKFEKS
jgi:hypothetical protein